MKARSAPTNTTWWSKPPPHCRPAPTETYVFQSIGDGRVAAFLPARSPLNDLLGLAMIIADAKFLDSKGAAKFVTPTTTNLMRRLAFLRKPTAPAAPVTPPPGRAAPAANRVASPPPQGCRRRDPPRRRRPPRTPRRSRPQPARPAALLRAPARLPRRRPARPRAARASGSSPAKPPVAPPKAAQPAARPAAPAARPGQPASPRNPLGAATSPAAPTSDTIAFEISDIDPKSLLKGAARQAPAEPKRPDLRVVQTDRLPKLELKLEADPIPELIQDEEPAAEVALEPMYAEPVDGEEETTEVEALAEPDSDMNVEPEFVDEARAAEPPAPASSSSTARFSSCTFSSS